MRVCVCVLQGHGEADRRLSPGVGGRGRSPLIYIYILSTSNWENHGDLLDSHGAFLDLGLQGPAVPLSFRLIFPNRLLSMPVTPGASPSCG